MPIEKESKRTIREVVTGSTGSGKTYYALNKARQHGRFLYLAPCRQLAYESFMNYSNPNKDELNSGEINIKCESIEQSENYFGVFETGSERTLDCVDSIIIDEVHFINDIERGHHLRVLINLAMEKNKNIFLLTATLNFEPKKIYPSFKSTWLKPKASFVKKFVPWEEAWRMLTRHEKKTIIFCKNIKNTNKIASDLNDIGLKGGAINSKTPLDERIKLQILFEKGEIDFVTATTILGQGLNFPAENLIFDFWVKRAFFGSEELFQQMLGRLGRYGKNNTSQTLTYTTRDRKYKIKKEHLNVMEPPLYTYEENDMLSMNAQLTLENFERKHKLKVFQVPNKNRLEFQYQGFAIQEILNNFTEKDLTIYFEEAYDSYLKKKLESYFKTIKKAEHIILENCKTKYIYKNSFN